MTVKRQVQIVAALILLVALAVQGCAPRQTEPAARTISTLAPGDVPTWTPRLVDLTRTALPTATRPAPVSIATTVTPTLIPTSSVVATPQTVRVSIQGGNLFVHRGPGLEYNYAGVLKDGETVLATGRDRVSRWIRIALPSNPLKEGWITTETKYTQIEGDVPNLPYIETEPARPAFIRNCTRHDLVVRPDGVKLLSQDDEPYNEEQFSVGVYQVYDLENLEDKPIKEVNLSEGETVEIQYDWTGEKTKCE